MAACLETAMEAAGVAPEEVQYINAHGTSTPLNDKFETMAYKRVFGEHAYKMKISSTKGATGHLLGAAGGVEAAIVCKVLETGVVPPTINYETPDPDCDLDYVPNVKHVADKPIEVAITDNLGFGARPRPAARLPATARRRLSPATPRTQAGTTPRSSSNATSPPSDQEWRGTAPWPSQDPSGGATAFVVEPRPLRSGRARPLFALSLFCVGAHQSRRVLSHTVLGPMVSHTWSWVCEQLYRCPDVRDIN